jgi:hypothetical protein
MFWDYVIRLEIVPILLLGIEHTYQVRQTIIMDYGIYGNPFIWRETSNMALKKENNTDLRYYLFVFT